MKTMNKTTAHRLPKFVTYSKKMPTRQIILDLTPDEIKKLEKYCKQTGKAVKDVIRQLIQELPLT